jgi:DNA-binding beta-propeller fold protein YncE
MVFAPSAARAELPAPGWMQSFPLLAGPQVILMWTPVPGAKTYKVYLDGKVGLKGITGFQATIPAPKEGGEHLFEVVAVDAKGKEGKKSAPGKIMIVLLEPPRELQTLSTEEAISIRWGTTKGAVIYDLYRREKGKKEFRLLTSTQETRHSDSKVSKGKTYLYAVKGKDVTGKSSDFSKPVEASLEVVSRVGSKNFKLIPLPVIKKVSYDLEFFYPQDVAVSSDGRVLVAADKLILFPGEFSEFADTLQLMGGKNGFNGVGFGKNGEILAANQSGKAFVLDPTGGKVLKTLVIPRPKGGVLKYGFAERPGNPHMVSNNPSAVDIAQDADGNYYVTDNTNYRLVKFSPEGKFLATVDFAPKKEDWLVFNPTFVAIDGKGNKFVTQISDVVVFDKDDKRAGVVGALGTGVGSFAKVKGLAIDPEGHLLASDVQNGSIQGFGYNAGDKSWEPVFALSNETKKKNIQASSPTGIAISPDGKTLYVAESMGKRITQFAVMEK